MQPLSRRITHALSPFCIYSISSGPQAARSLWSYRRHHPAVSIVAVCLDGPTLGVIETAERERIQIIDVPEADFGTSRFQNTYLTATLSRFVDLPPLLPAARLYLMVDADTLCLSPLPFDALYDRMAASGAVFAAAPEAGPDIWRRYLSQSRRTLERHGLGHLELDVSATMYNAGVVAWRPVATGVGFPEEFDACLREIEAAGDAAYELPGPDQVIVNVLAERHAGGRFLPLETTWNERRAYRQSCAYPEWPAAEGRGDAMIWHCRDNFEQLWTECYEGR